jgi:flagellar protein FlaG
MDTLNGLSPQPYKGSGSAQAPPVPVGKAESGGTVNAVATATVVAPTQDVLSAPQNHETKQQISSAVKDINDFFQMTQRSLGFSLDEASGVMVMQITDTKTGELIRQIPGEAALKLAKQLDELTGVLFKAQA